MKVGDLIEVFQHVPRHEAGDIPIGCVGKGLLVEIKKHDRCYPETAPDTTITYLTADGEVKKNWIDKEHSGVVVTVRIVQDGNDVSG